MKFFFFLLLFLLGLAACNSNVDPAPGEIGNSAGDTVVDTLDSLEPETPGDSSPSVADEEEEDIPAVTSTSPEAAKPTDERGKSVSTALVAPDGTTTAKDDSPPADPTSSDEPKEDLDDVPDDLLPTRSPADRDALMRTFSLKPKIAYLNNMVSFRIETPERKKWKWEYNLDGDKYWDSSRESLNSYTYKELGLKKISVQAKSKDFNIPFQEEIIVTVSKSYLNKVFQELKSLAKTADASPSDKNKQAVKNKFDEILKIASDGIMFDIAPDLEPGDINFDEFKDVIYAEVGFENIYDAITEYKYDKKTGQVTFVKLR